MKRVKTYAALILMLVWATITNGCGSGQGSPVSVTPGTLFIARSGSATLTAKINGAASSLVTWSVQESNGGAITSAGVYTAPATAGTYHVLATSQFDSTQTAVATIEVKPTSTVTVPQMAGDWIGTWHDTTAGTSGNITLNISVNETAKTVIYSLGMTGAVLGVQFGPPNPERCKERIRPPTWPSQRALPRSAISS